MTSICRIAFYMTALSTAVVGGGCMTGEPEPAASEVASELASDCESGANGFIDISDGLSGTVRRSADLGFNVLLTLESGTVSGATRGWAKISGATIPGDQVSMDWTVTGGAPPQGLVRTVHRR